MEKEIKLLLEEMMVYIEGMEEMIDEVKGRGRNFQQIYRDGKVPDLYNEIIKQLQKASLT